MDHQFSEEQLKSLAAQLRCPQGAMGIETALNMNTGNEAMISETINLLDLQADTDILELGPGNAQHLAALLDQYKIRSYYGLEISATMCEQAIEKHKHIQHPEVQFSCYDGLRLPFENGSFDGIFTINTIYFWEQPQLLLREIARVLKPGGKFLLTFAGASFMEQLPFVQYGFTLYDTKKVADLLKETGLEIEAEWHKKDFPISKVGTKVSRPFTILKLRRPGAKVA